MAQEEASDDALNIIAPTTCTHWCDCPRRVSKKSNAAKGGGDQSAWLRKGRNPGDTAARQSKKGGGFQSEREQESARKVAAGYLDKTEAGASEADDDGDRHGGPPPDSVSRVDEPRGEEQRRDLRGRGQEHLFRPPQKQMGRNVLCLES